ncbi:MAG: PorT family protein [Bacteroidales bacterium]|nr:PorT family protein [Bacteroidales bacterium]
MKKAFFILVALMLVSAPAFAQLRIGGGFANSMDRFNTEKKELSTNTANGAYAGVDFNIPIVGDLSLVPGVYYTFLASNAGRSALGGLVNAGAKTQEHYINVPLRFEYGSEILPNFRLFFFGGPSVSYGLASKTKYSAGILDYKIDTVLDNYAAGGYGRWDVMVGGGMGFDLINRIRLSVGYDFGMLNRNTNSTAITRHRNQLNAGVALLF